jgi:hypothetical protein
MGYHLESKPIFCEKKLFQKYQKHIKMKGGLEGSYFLNLGQYLPMVKNFHFDTILTQIKLLPSSKPPTSLLVSSYINYYHVPETCPKNKVEKK